MNDDFNPFDLSAAPKPVEKPPQDLPGPKPIVNRVSFGPLFHSWITRCIALLLALVLMALVGFVGMKYHLNRKAAKNNLSATQTTTQTAKSSSAGGTATTPSAKSTASSTTPAASTPTTPSGAAASSTVASYCGVSGMPKGVCTAITSVEKDGIKNNQYVTADTSQLPDGATVDVDQGSWFQGEASSGTANFTATASGKSYAGVAYFEVSNGVWKVTSYTLNQ